MKNTSKKNYIICQVDGQ
ncbi:hypothetical protein SAMN02744124_03074 [Paenibacillus barengoltzii J12]|uniref:Uncharacterized protein n=1 Tax=Paenibacillus barengoltzii J12 TaxID=935846 RepID=A0ABY1LZY8_9BACL|nr:hypothetical protein SAMN02744124_03074 [Paenibacillus barengoltzii J12]